MSASQRATLAHRKSIRRARQQRRRKIWAAISAFAIALPIVSSVAMPAVADNGSYQYLSVHKSVDEANPLPGETFVYTIDVNCSEASCLEAALVDNLPSELEGFELQSVEAIAVNQEVEFDVSWSESGAPLTEAPAVIGAETGVRVDFTSTVTAPDGTGLQNGETFRLQLWVRVPETLAPGSYEIDNTVETSAANSSDDDSTATVNIEVPINIDVDPSKNWSPAEANFNPGTKSTIELGAKNTSNVDVDRIIVQEPQAAADGAADLADSNPFTITDFDNFGTATLPSGVDVQVDAYVYDGTSWNWVSGTAADSPALPSGVDPADVGGLRFTYTGDLEPEANPTVEFDVAQRAEHRNDGDDLSTDTHRVDNVAQVRAESDEHGNSDDKEAQARHEIKPAELGVETSKNISPNATGAGNSVEATISATNGGSPVAELRLEDLGFFTEDITFYEFTAGPSWPTGATDAKVIYHLLDGSGTQEVSFTEGNTPAAPTEKISGFEIVFTADGDEIEPGANTTAEFQIDTTEEVADEASSETFTNTVTSTATAANNRSAEASDSDTLKLITPALTVRLDKGVRPSTAVRAGESVFVDLETRAIATDRAKAHELVIEDAIGAGDDQFWDAFDLVSIAPTQVPGETEMTIEVQDENGDWHEISTYGPEFDATIFQLNRADFASAIAPLTSADLTGVRFTLENDPGFSNDITVTPNLVFDARSTLRESGDPVADGEETTYVNGASASVNGESEGGKDLDDDDDSQGDGTVEPTPPGVGVLSIEKQWLENSVSALSDDRATTALSWKVDSGFDTVTITDPAADFGNVENTVFDAFDLVRVDPISASNTAFTNGWYLKYDTITKIEFYGENGWEEVAAPADGWIQNGAFVGYELDADEQAETTAVRIELAENTTAREAAHEAGEAFDPFAPAPGSGVATSSIQRTFDLTWQVRDQKRSDDAWVTSSADYNAADAGVVDNTVEIVGTNDDGDSRDIDSDIIPIVDHDPAVKVTKEIDNSDDIFVTDKILESGDLPTRTWTLTAHNAAVPKAGHVRVLDPSPCAEGQLSDCQTTDPNANPFDGADATWFEDSIFEFFNITGMDLSASIGDEVDLEHTVIWVLRYDESDSTFDSEKIVGATALAAADLSDVVAFSVTFQAENAGKDGVGNTITQDNQLTITLETELRTNERSTGSRLEYGVNDTEDVENRIFAQSYDDILRPDTQTGDVDDAATRLTGGTVNIHPTKSVTPDEIVSANPDVPVTVKLGANQGADPRSTLSPDTVVIEDQADSPDFWNTFNFTGIEDVTLPAGADRVQVDVFGDFDGNGKAWLEGTAAADATLPIDASDFDAVEGIRFTFTRADGEYFDASLPPANNWSVSAEFTVELRDTYRDSGDEVQFSGEVTNTQTSQSLREDGKNSEKKDSDGKIVLGEGTQEIEVKKLTNNGNRTSQAGNAVPFKLQFKNSGTGYLTITELRDTLPAELVYTGSDEPVYTAESTGLLSEDVELEVDGQDLIFTWPEGENLMAPGEVFTVDVKFELQPALGRVYNDIVVTTEETLDRCGHIDGGANWDQPGGDTTCATEDYVELAAGANLFTVKGVRGSLTDTEYGGGYRNSSTQGEVTCDPTLEATGGSYFRAPCISHSEVGGVDDWVLRTQNAGTVPVYEATIFEQLPTEGDRMLIGAGRDSTFRPQLVADSLEIEAPEGTDLVVEVTTSSGVCNGTWSGLETNEPCEQNGEVWEELGSSVDWGAVTGLRVTADFKSTSGGALQIGQFIDVTFSTKNVLADAGDASGVPAEVGADDQFAWNQFGVKYRDGDRVKKIAPAKVGVHLRSSAIEVSKLIEGAASDYAPESFEANVQCSVGGVDLDMGDAATVTLDADNDYNAIIDGIPFSSVDDVVCVVEEEGDTGHYGETSRSITPQGGTLEITTPATNGDDGELAVPEGQSAVLTNTYDFTGLSVTKHVDTEATEGEFGPFDFELQCTSALGDDVTFDADGATTLAFTLADGETFEVPEGVIPVGASCVLNETDNFFADSLHFTGDNVSQNDDGTATITPGTAPAEVDVYNGYDSGTLTVEKIIEGAGAELYGAGPFGFDAQCTYQGQELLDESFELEAGATKSFGIFPAGTDCVVTETATGGATATVLDPEDGLVQVVDSEDETESATVTATNTFDVGSLEIVKLIEGEGAELYGAGPFEAQVMCTWDRDGFEESIELANDGVITLSESNDYRAIIDNLLVGAHCEVVETATGGANSTSVDPEDGVVTIPGLDEEAQPQAAVVTLTNVFDLTSLDVVKELRGDVTATGANGPFEVELACLRDVDGEDVPVDIPGGAVRELSEEGDYLAHYADLPLGAECVVTEIEDGGAASTEITLGSGADQVSVNGNSLEFALDDAEADYVVHVINTFDPDPVDPEEPGDPKPPTWLPRTGAEILTAIAVGLLLVLAGVGLFRARRAEK